MKQENISLEGKVVELSMNGVFKIETDVGVVNCKSAGKFKTRRIKLVEGDKVRIEVSPYDNSTGLIYERIDKPKTLS
jgi:translation initiation factor IF-1